MMLERLTSGSSGYRITVLVSERTGAQFTSDLRGTPQLYIMGKPTGPAPAG